MASVVRGPAGILSLRRARAQGDRAGFHVLSLEDTNPAISTRRPDSVGLPLGGSCMCEDKATRKREEKKGDPTFRDSAVVKGLSSSAPVQRETPAPCSPSPCGRGRPARTRAPGCPQSESARGGDSPSSPNPAAAIAVRDRLKPLLVKQQRCQEAFFPPKRLPDTNGTSIPPAQA